MTTHISVILLFTEDSVQQPPLLFLRENRLSDLEGGREGRGREGGREGGRERGREGEREGGREGGYIATMPYIHAHV